ncbi:exodeoxyribonuclease V subunit gamma [Edwardsiella anguillarum]|nr:exodeoxyribonuclease V subunit gamma [Edwardsiella anguillarum]
MRDLALPATGQHTWQFGLTRMLLGYAMDSRSGEWQGCCPTMSPAGRSPSWLGSWRSFWRRCAIGVSAWADADAGAVAAAVPGAAG